MSKKNKNKKSSQNKNKIVQIKKPIRESFSSESQLNEAEIDKSPEALRFLEKRQGVTFKSEDIIHPIITVKDLVGHKSSTDDEVRLSAGNSFDELNIQLLEASIGAKESLPSASESLTRRQEQSEASVEGSDPIRSLISSKKLVEPTMYVKILVPFLVILSIILIGLEWGSQASMLQMSGDEAFLGEGGFLKALFTTPVLIMMTLGIKSWFSSASKRVHKRTNSLSITFIIALGVTYFMSFSIYYGGLQEMNPTSLELPDALWKQIMMFTQLSIGPISSLLIFNFLEKQSQKYGVEEVFFSEEHLVNDEEYVSISARRQDVDTSYGRIHGFEKAYQSSKLVFEQRFINELEIYKIKLQAVIAIAEVDLITETEKPELKIVGIK